AAETVALYSHGGVVPNVRYNLRDTPCENVSGKKLCCYPQGVQGLFPRDTMLTDMRAESYIGIPLWDSKGRPIGLIVVIDCKPMANTELIADVLQIVATRTASELERNRTEEEKGKLQAQLLQAMKMEAVGRLAGGVAHDFNNLLTVVIGNVSLALGKIPASDPVTGMLSEVNRAAERAARLTQQLLAFSRKQIIEPKVLDLNALIVELHSMLVRLIGEHIEIATVPGEGLGMVKVDPGQMEQILVNLAVNARDAMRDGGQLRIETANAVLDDAYCDAHPDARPGRYVRLSVSDTGHGMTDEVRAQIFEPFFTTKPKGSGTGLGLSMTYGAVKQVGGSIEVLSEPGKGTTVRIFLPREEPGPEPEPGTGPPQKPLGGTETVLLVEDEEVLRGLCVQVLEQLGYRVLQAGNGADAIALAREYGGRIDLLLTDVVMPGMNGSELATHLVILHPETKVLFTSGYTDDAIVHHGVLDEGVFFIGKPYTPSALAKKVREVLDRA
ncbi:MAG: response regulator, partial [Deltaproteobacteria bacterium]